MESEPDLFLFGFLVRWVWQMNMMVVLEDSVAVAGDGVNVLEAVYMNRSW
jgi:hypothetical protein